MQMHVYGYILSTYRMELESCLK